MQDAFATALARWPESGLPPSPAGWIITTARNRAIDRLRREASRADRHAQAALLHARDEPAEEDAVHDDRLRLIFTCCHPALGDGRAGRAHTAAPRRPDDAGDRARLPRARADDGAADRPRQGQDPRRRHPLPRPRRARAAPPAARGAGGALPDLQRRATRPPAASGSSARICAPRRSGSVACWSRCCPTRTKRSGCSR